MKDISHRIEALSYEEVINHLLMTADDFTRHHKEFYKKYAIKLSHNAMFAIARTVSNEMIGIIAFYSNQKPAAFISHVWVSRTYRGNGLCRKMLQDVIDYCKKNGYNYVRLEVRNDNISAQKAYLRYGFKFIEYTQSNKLLEFRIL